MALYRINKPRNPQAKFHVKKNDEVVVLTGTQQGKRGKVLEVLRDRSRVIIEGVNFIKKSSRKSQQQPEGGIVEREGALHISKVMLATAYDSRKSAVTQEDKKEATPKHVAHKPAEHKHAEHKHAAHKKAAPKAKK